MFSTNSGIIATGCYRNFAAVDVGKHTYLLYTEIIEDYIENDHQTVYILIERNFPFVSDML
jgi:hypothetical protein